MKAEAHRQKFGDGAGLIDAVGAGAAHVQFLQTDDVRLQLGDHGGDARHVQLAVDADAAVHIIGDESGHGSLSARSIPQPVYPL
ncbi:hypothetical protein D3C81_1961160 [compost metagenome]